MSNTFNGCFVCCVCGARWDIYDRKLNLYFCNNHTGDDLPTKKGKNLENE